MELIFWWILLGLFLSLGFLGCFINKVPGPFFVVLASVVAVTALDLPIGWGHFAVIAILAFASIFFSKVLVKLVKKMHDYSKGASIGTTLGSIVGLLFLVKTGNAESSFVTFLLMILCLIIPPFVLAFIFEFMAKKDFGETMKGASSATAAYISDTFLKLVVFAFAVYMMFFSASELV